MARRPARGSCACSATRASTCTTRSTTGTTRASCSRCARPEAAVDGASCSRAVPLRRPLLEALEADERVVLLIDEIDRADDEFEAFLLELLADFASRSPSSGTCRPAAAAGRPDLEPHPRAARRAQAALPVPLDRLPDARARACDRRGARPPASPDVAARVAGGGPLREAELYKAPGGRRDDHLGRAR
jgi:hypothetical protein